MTAALPLLLLLLVLLLALAWPLGRYIDAVLQGRLAWARRLEAPLFRLAGVQPEREQGWLAYALGLLVFNGLGVLAVYALQRLQGLLPLNPLGRAAVAPDLALNTALSFVTNTNWQAYAGESTLSPLTQMAALTVQNFLSAATGIAVLQVLLRGLARAGTRAVGVVWVDLTRVVLWILLPLSLVFAVALAGLGVVQTLRVEQAVIPLQAPSPAASAPDTPTAQTLALGPVASQVAIKMLGTNGGGYFNANAAHPFENPDALSNLLQMLAMLLIPTALCFTFGRQVGDLRQGWAVLAAMTLVLVGAVLATTAAEGQRSPAFAGLAVDTQASALQPGGNMEGKELRFGIRASALFATLTTATACGAVNAMHDSFTPLGGAVPLVMMQLGEVVFGGVGSGLYGMLLFALLAAFIAGLMIGRTPEYLGKKIEAHEMKLVGLALLVTPLLVLLGTALAVQTEAGRAALGNPGPHGFTEVLYALTSAANNNGSAFGGLSVNTPFYNVLLGVVMWLGRFAVIVPVLAVAGALADKPRLAAGAGTLPTHGPVFVLLLVGVVLMLGLLNHVPALALGPLAEHLTHGVR